MLSHIVLVVHLLEGYDASYHFLHEGLMEADADALPKIAVAVPLGGIVPVFGKAGRIV